MAEMSRLRRWIRRAVYVLLAVPAAAGLALLIYVWTGHPERLARERTAEALQRMLGRPVVVDRVSLRYLPPGIVVEGVRAEGPRLEVARAEAWLSVRALLRGRIAVKDLDLWQPVLVWDTDTERFVPQRPAGSPPAASPGRFAARFDLRRLRLHGGAVMVGSHRREITADVEGLELHADNMAPGYKGPFEGSLVFRKGRFALGDLELAGLAGSIAFEVDRESVRTRRVRLKAEGVDIRAAGQVQPGSPPRGRFEGVARLDPEGPALSRPLPQFGARELSCDLRVTMSADGVKVTGGFEAEDPVIDADRRRRADGSIEEGPAVPWPAARASGTLSVEPGRIEVAGTLTSFAGGGIAGSYVGTKYGPSADTPREHEVRVTATGLDISEVLAHFHLPGDEAVVPSARLSGDASVRWSGDRSDQMTGSADLTFTRGEGDLPVSGSAAVGWRGSRVAIGSASLEMPGSMLELAGTANSASMERGGPLAFDLTGELAAEDLAPLATFLERRFPALSRGTLRPTDLGGKMAAHIEVRGDTARPDVRASFTSDGLVASVPSPAGGAPAHGADRPRVQIPLTGLAGEAAYRTDLLALDLTRIEGEDLSARGALQVQPQRGEILSLTLEAASLPASLLARFAGLDPERLPAGGTLRGEARMTGRSGTFVLQGERLTLGPLSFDGPKAIARLEEDTIHLDEVSLRWCGGTATAKGDLTLGPHHPTGSLDVAISGIDLAAVDAAHAGPSMTGEIDLAGALAIDSGVFLTATLEGRGVHLAGIDLDRLDGSLAGPIAGAPGALHLELKDAPGNITASADFSTTGTVEGAVTVRGFSLEEVRPLLPPGALPGLDGEADGVITVSGPLAEPSALLVRALLSRVSLTAGDDPLRNAEPVRVTVQDGFLTLAPMRLMGEKTDLTAGGSMSLSGHHDITARIEGRYDLALAEMILPEMRASGPGTADLRVIQRGDLLTYEGQITVDGGTVRHPALPQPLENIHGRARFTEQGLLNIEELRFDTGGGRATGAGWVRFEGAGVPRFHLAMSGQGIRAEILPDLQAFFDAEMALDKDGGAYRFSGHVAIQRAVYTRSFGVEPTELLLRNREFAPVRERRADAPEVVLDIDITAERDVWIRNEDALIEASAHLSLEGTLDEPELSGRISALEGGTYRFRDVTYRIAGGALDFADVARIDPLIDIEAVTRVQQYEITLRITGRFSKPIYELASDPPLPQRDVVWLLLTGHPMGDSATAGAGAAAEGQVAAYLAAPVTGAVSAPLQKFLGVSSVQIDPFFLNGTADPSARVTVTKRVASDLLFTYSNSLGQSGQEIYQIEYNPGRLWDLLATRDLDGSVGADLRFRRRWRGWGWTGAGAETTAGDGRQAFDDPRRVRVGSILVVADRLVDSQKALIRSLPFDPGDTLRRGDLLEGRELLRQRYARHGYPAAHVELVETPGVDAAGEGTVDVKYAVLSGPRHDLDVRGNVRERPIRKAVRRAWQEPILLDDLAEEARKATLGLLKRDGFYSARVEAGIQPGPPPEETRVVTLWVDRGPKVKVRSIAIGGNRGMSEDRIRRQMLTREGGVLSLFGRGLLKEPELEDDLAAIRGLYLANGYLSVRVAPPEVRLSQDGRQADVTITIEEEGPQSRIGAVVIEGEARGVPGEDLLRAAGLSRTQVVNAELISLAADRLREALDKEGYSRARVSTRLEGSPENTRVVFSIVPMERARINEVTFEGNTRTRDRIVDREIEMDEGEYLSRSSLLATQRNLYRLGVFRSVQIDTEPAPGKPGFVDVKVKLQEGTPLLTAWGVGYDTKDRTRGTFEIANNNLFGTRRSAALFVRGSAVDRRVQVTLRDPNLFGEKIETLLSGFGERQELESFGVNRTGIVSQLSRKLDDHITLFGRYRIEDLDLFKRQVEREETGVPNARLASAAVSVARDTRDDIVSPTRGGLSSADYRIYHQALGSEVQFTRFFLSFSKFKSVGRGVVWASSVRAGILTSKDIPISERFFAGGDTTLRGFKFNTVGPLEPARPMLEHPNRQPNPCPGPLCDPTQKPNNIIFPVEDLKPVGGDALFLINQELRFPIIKALKGVVFYDAGNVYGSVEDFDVTDLRSVLGAGLRFDTPVGPFRIEYGRKLDHDFAYDVFGNVVGRRDESRGEFFFSIGQAF